MASKHLKRDEVKERLGEMPERSFARLVAAGLPRKGDGASARFPWPECFHWYIKHKEEAVRREVKAKEASERPADLSVVEAERRERQARAEIQEMKRDQLRGTLTTQAAYDEEFGEMTSRLSAAARSLTSRYMRDLVSLGVPELEAAKLLGRVERGLLEEMREAADEEESEEPAA